MTIPKKFEPETFYGVRMKRAVELLGVTWKPCDRHGRPKTYEMKGKVAEQLREHIASVD